MSTRAGRNLEQLAAVCVLLEPLLDRFVLVGGCATGLLITDPGSPDVRATLDVDLIVDVVSHAAYAKLEKAIRSLGFQPEMSDEVICRWRHGDYLVDIMPTDETILGFSNPWYKPAIESAMTASLSKRLTIRHVSAPYFLATKLAAFKGRGGEDYGASHDIDDLIAVVDGRAELVDEIQNAPAELIVYIAESITELLKEDDFRETLSWHLPPDEAGQGRLPFLRDRLELIANLGSAST